MSAIPPNWLGSVAQTQGAQARSAADKNREAGAAAERADPTFAERLTNEIEASDRDSQVYSDAEGAGSKGRPFDDQAEPPADESADDEADAPESGGLDVQA